MMVVVQWVSGMELIRIVQVLDTNIIILFSLLGMTQGSIQKSSYTLHLL